MPFTLKPDGPNRWKATAGNRFTIDANASTGTVSIRDITYNGDTISAPGPFTFTAVAGSKIIVIVYVATSPTADITFVEKQGNTSQDLTDRSGSDKTATLWVNRA